MPAAASIASALETGTFSGPGRAFDTAVALLFQL